jgi:hypothetical protein
MTSYIWIAATPDEYELPVYVADSATELARIMGCTLSNISKLLHYQKRGQVPKKYKIIKLTFKEDKDEQRKNKKRAN